MTNFKRVLAHKLGNLVMLARNPVELMDEPDLMPDQREQLRAVLIESLERMEQIVRDVADIGRAETLHEEPKRNYDLHHLLANVVESHQNAVRDRGLTLDYAPDIMPGHDLYGQEQLIGRAIDALIDNAVKFTPEGDIAVTLTTTDDHAVIAIHDTGVGINATDLPDVCDPFYRAKTNFVSSVPGNGLGLTVAQAVIEAHGGTLSIESVPDSGSAVTVRLPLQIIMA